MCEDLGGGAGTRGVATQLHLSIPSPAPTTISPRAWSTSPRRSHVPNDLHQWHTRNGSETRSLCTAAQGGTCLLAVETFHLFPVLPTGGRASRPGRLHPPREHNLHGPKIHCCQEVVRGFVTPALSHFLKWGALRALSQLFTAALHGCFFTGEPLGQGPRASSPSEATRVL